MGAQMKKWSSFVLLANADAYLQPVLTSLYNKTLSLESRIDALQKQSTTNELPPALHAAVTNAVNAEVKPII